MNLTLSSFDLCGHDKSVHELANRYWSDPHRIRRALAEGVDISGTSAHLIAGLRNQRSKSLGYTPEIAATVLDEILEALDAELLFQAEQDFTAAELAWPGAA